jgi:CBS domain-containing protein
VVEGDQLVGIVTSYDFLDASARLFQEHLERPTPATYGRALAQTA